jgi:cysteine desulfurase
MQERDVLASVAREHQPLVYLDHNATTPPHPDVISVMSEVAQASWGNPASVHGVGRKAREVVEETRSCLSRLLSVQVRDVVFVGSATEANNMALADAPAVVTSVLEHPSVVRAAQRVEGQGRTVRWISPQPSGVILPEAVAEALSGLPIGTVVAIQAVNHEVGTVMPLLAISEVVRAHGAFLHVDLAQAVGKIAESWWRYGDSYSVSPHKFRGPKGIAAFAWGCQRPVPHPILWGGSQERGLRAGTVDPVLAAGFGVALGRLTSPSSTWPIIQSMRDELEEGLAGIAVPNSSECHRIPHVSSLFVQGWDADTLVAALDVEGFCVSGGSACSAGTTEQSSVIASVFGPERARGTIRVSLGETTTPREVARFVDALRRVVGRVQQREH